MRRWRDRALLTTYRAAAELVADRGHRDAAQISFFALLSAVPLALLLVAGFGLVFEDADVRRRIVRTVFASVPLATDADRAQLERATSSSLSGAGSLGPLSIVLLLVAASGVMGALRHAINQAWDIDRRPPLLRRKALDLALVLGAAIVLALSLSVSATHGLAGLLDHSRTGGALAALLDAVGEVLPYVFAFAVVLFLYRVLPVERPVVREIWPGAAVAAVGLALTKGALGLYFAHLADFGAVYGSLGALMALLLFVFISANVLVFGAEFASEWSRLPPDLVTRRLVALGRRRLARALRLRR